MSDDAMSSAVSSGSAATEARSKKRRSQWPDVYKVSIDDLIEVTAAGVNDFRAAPKYGLFFGGMYAVVGWLLVGMLWFFEFYYLVYPIAMGFALIAPFASVGFYSVSDFLEKGKPLSWHSVFSAVKQSTGRDLRWMALITGFTFFMWIDYAMLIFLSFMGFEALGPQALDLVFTTSQGWLFLIFGNLAGATLAILVFSISVVTYPMLYDRDVDFVTAMVTSVRLVIANPISMLAWCAFITVLTGLSLLSFFAGLFVMLPVLGHASWHLYRRAVGPQPGAISK
ncbi:MAG: DUF2189 domain-containing protein [Hyphomicrobiaceae bacterium]|nr:DUF2189 domain-containing protein [Hyphomicrobiaceae bacterium]MCC0009458.1 DUF2189 domain-containing protein [Hyphomicrobiaceae bacterium]